MFNKKVGLLVLASMGLVACGGGQSSSSHATGLTSSTTPTSSEGPTIPTEEGKVTLYFLFVDTETAKLADMPEYCSPFITGNWNGYGTSPESASEMIRLEGTNYFYAQIAAGLDMGDNGYQITIGYNAASNVGTDKQGIDWNYKTTYSTENFPGLDHPVLTKLADNLYEAKAGDASGLGFAAFKPAPEIVKNPSLRFKITLNTDEVFGENLEYVIKGDFNGWTPTALGDPDEEGYYTVELGDEVIVGKYEYCVGVRNKFLGGQDDRYNLMMAELTPEEEENLDVIGGAVEEVIDADTGEVEEYDVTNFAISLNKIYGDDYVYEGGRLTNPRYASGTTEEYRLPSNEAPKMQHGVIVRLSNTAETVNALWENLSICGDFTSGWSEHKAMTEVEEGKTWEYYVDTTEDFVGLSKNFKFTNGSWDAEIGIPGETEGSFGNVVLGLDQDVPVVEFAADLSGATAKIGCEEVEEPDDVALTHDILIAVKNTGEGTPTTVSIPGEWNGWSHDLTLTESGEYWVVTIPHGELVHGQKVNFKLADGTWDHNIGMGGDNAFVYVDYHYNAIYLEGDIAGFTGEVEFAGVGLVLDD